MTSDAGAAVIAAVITAAVAVVVSVLTQVWTSRRDRNDQVYARRRAALIDVQDAALELRTALARYGQQVRRSLTAPDPVEPAVIRISVPDQVDLDQLRAAGRLEVCASRVDDPPVVAALVRWQQDASAAFLSTADVTAEQEQRSWQGWTQLVGQALRSASGLSGGS